MLVGKSVEQSSFFLTEFIGYLTPILLLIYVFVTDVFEAGTGHKADDVEG